ncbi:hypothetical protein KC235_13795, partial [Klebsiella michiganensis]|uniref:hypothetical protein n=1 Tax=Klebsiella michiganensis TaxID=1134687 RepID=UPI001B825540
DIVCHKCVHSAMFCTAVGQWDVTPAPHFCRTMAGVLCDPGGRSESTNDANFMPFPGDTIPHLFNRSQAVILAS